MDVKRAHPHTTKQRKRKMIKLKMFVTLAVTLGAFFISVTPAFAEFESKNGGLNQGKGEIYKTTLEAGGATVTCRALEEGTGKATWTVENKEERAQKKRTWPSGQSHKLG
jgi:hypothetical protein